MSLNKVVPDRGEPIIIGMGRSREAIEFRVGSSLFGLRKKRDMTSFRVIGTFIIPLAKVVKG
jgi:hypothetical protein